MREKRSWRELSPAQQAGISLATIVQITLAVLAYRDLHRRPADQVRGAKSLWYAVCAINFAGPLAYFAFGRVR